MVFSATSFLFGFLPIVLSVALALRSVRARNVWLLAASLLFYAWGEFSYTGVLLLSILWNHALGLLIDRWRKTSRARLALAAAVSGNLALLFAFKYANFAAANWNRLAAAIGMAPLELDPIHLPIGISFFTFQALTYVIDVHRGDAAVERNPLRVGLYIALFPQLIAGPIVRYREVAAALRARAASLDDLAGGARRFVIGLGKKVLIANTLAVPTDAIFGLPPEQLSAAVAWLGALTYALQIYFDFSGYSDMAIGLGRMLGFRFPENFRIPYAAGSVREFWRRWHISLSTWFRDYLFIPLGGSRGSAVRTARNLVTVFLLCGLWHGASWNFVIWGGLHGAFLALERSPFGAGLARLPFALRNLYTLFVVLVGWVFFRAETLPAAVAHLGAMFGQGSSLPEVPAALGLLANDARLALFAGLVGSTPAMVWAAARLRRWSERSRASERFAIGLRFAAIAVVFLGCAISVVAGTHDPFIYFRF